MQEITSKLLKEKNYENKTLISKLELAEEQKKLNEQFINYYNKKKQDLENKYNTKQEADNLNKKYIEELNAIKNEYTNDYKDLQETLSKLEFDRNRNLSTNNIYKVEIDIKNSIIYSKKNYKLNLQIKIAKLELKLVKLQAFCNKNLLNIDVNYENILSKYIGEQTPCIFEGGTTNEISEDQIIKKINELENINKSFIVNKDKYLTDEKNFKENHLKFLEEEKVIINTKLKNIEKYYKLEIESMNNLINYYNTLTKLNNLEEINNLKEKLDNIIVKLDIDIDKLDQKFILLNDSVNSYDTMCLKKMNKLKCYKNNNK